MTSGPDDLSSFNGVARLFPLPDFVLFPHVVAPLHIFEPRYREMTKDALDSDRLIALVLLKPGWEEDYEATPPVHDVACLGQIINDQKLADGKYNLLVRGLCRLRLEKEVPSQKLYRLAQGWPLPDGADAPSELRERLANAALPLLPSVDSVLEQMKELFSSPLPLGGLCDVLSFAMPLSTEAKQELLAEIDIEQRASRLIEELKSGRVPEMLHKPRAMRRFPPDFSEN
jgi:Lon protease-like protein